MTGAPFLRKGRVGRKDARHAAGLLGLVAVLGLVAISLGLPTVAGTGASPTGTPGSPGTTVNVTTMFDGMPTWGHGSPSTAFSTTFDHPFDLKIAWSAHGGALGTPTLVTVTGARVSVVLLTESAFTKEVDERNPLPAASGAINMTLDFTQNRYLVEGVYLLSVTLLGANSSTVATQTFYLHANATYHLVALNVGLAALILYEVIGVLVSLHEPGPDGG
ncbi:MAG: hypothetical protein ACREDK_09640 [Thermoplasmata archaeon]